mmetsp:Transcript_18139/g.20670  ORF Transcript_18139/g.20670 Transcript_18139/m.20670 type:complete len:120 (+) Transcript_18139:136-495(+)
MCQITENKTNNNETEATKKHQNAPITEAVPTNEYVLNIAFFSFLFFVLFQAFFAVLARSQAMLADCMAMSVDAFTYLFNLVAERLKYYDPPIFGPVDNILKKSYGDGKLNVSIWNSHHH